MGVAIAIIAAWAALAVELGAVGISQRARLTSGWEAGMGSLLLAPSAFPLAAAVALLGAVGLQALANDDRARRWIFTALTGAFAGAVAVFVATGRHLAAPERRIGFTLLVLGVAGAAAYWLHPALVGFRAKKSRLFAVMAAGSFVAVEVANRFVLVRLYPAFHVGLAALALALAVAAIVPFLVEPLSRARLHPAALVAVTVVLIASFAFARPAAERLGRFDNFRLILVDHAPMLGHAVRAAALVAPPAADSEPSPTTPAPAASAIGVRGPSFTGRDVVLVSIDALRADHVGAYGYQRPTTPAIDALARDGVLFEHAYCPTPHTSYSVTSLMTGKYMRPLLLQGAGEDSETFASLLRTYGYRTAAFYPPAVFFIDQARFTRFERSFFGFEYRKVEFAEGEARVRQVSDYLGRLPASRRLFLWLHLFGPHEPYEVHPNHAFGDKDIDRYDGEVRAADETAGKVIAAIREKRPEAVVIVTADHGEEFREHGGRYHGTSVYEEQVRVPLVVSAPGLLPPRRVREVVQTIDLLPTVLSALSVPPSPRLRGRDLGPLLVGAAEGPGFAFSETDESELLASGPHRLVCARRIGACRLFDVERDPGEGTDLAATEGARLEAMRAEVRAFGASHGRFEAAGVRAETGRGWPAPILRAIAGDGDAATDLSGLLDDADREIRRKAAELLFVHHRAETVPAVRLALGRDEDPAVQRWCALALVRMGHSAPLAFDVYNDADVAWRRRAALALAESGDGRGQAVLIDWWQHDARDDFVRAREVLDAFAKIRAKDAVWPLVQSLRDVRLRPYVARTLAAIGEDSARGPLVSALADERSQTARIALVEAAVALGAKEELARPLVRFLGVPDPLPGGLGYAARARIVEHIGGPDEKGLKSLVKQSDVGVGLRVLVPKAGNGAGVRVLVRARAAGRSGEVRVGRRRMPLQYDSKGKVVNGRKLPEIHDTDFAHLSVPAGDALTEVYATLPPALEAKPGRSVELVVFAEHHVTLEAVAVVPLADELPPPPPEPWVPGDEGEAP
jgi:arylsulfatase A-like enzyme